MSKVQGYRFIFLVFHGYWQEFMPGGCQYDGCLNPCHSGGSCPGMLLTRGRNPLTQIIIQISPVIVAWME